LLEPHRGDQITHFIVSVLQHLSLRMCKPHHEGLPLVCLLLPLHDHEDEVLLTLSPKANVSPMANVTPSSPCFLALSEPSQYVQSIHLVPVVSLSLEVSFPPSVEELSFNLLVHVEPHKILVFVIFVHEIHSMSIPFS
jgi:hypothetical protein